MTKEAQELAAQQVNPRVAQRVAAMERVRELIGELDPEAAQRMDKASRGRATPSAKRPDDVTVWLAEALAALAQNAAEQNRPKRRGRPRAS